MQGGLFNSSYRRKTSFALQMTPMIDMIFLLLIFFFVSAKWKEAEQILPLNIAAAQAHQNQSLNPEPLVIKLSADEKGCKVNIGGTYSVLLQRQQTEKTLAVFAEKLEKCIAEQKRLADDPVEIVCEPGVKWQYLAKIYNLLYGAGLTDITLAIAE